MALPSGLLSSLLKYSKNRRRSLGHTFPGYAGQCATARPVTRVLGDDRHIISGGPASRPEVYMGDFPEQYFPDVGFMEIPESEYGSYEASFIQEPLPPTHQGFGSLTPDFDQLEVEYEDCLMTQELFELQMEMAVKLESVPLDLEQMIELKANQDLIEGALDIEEIVGSLILQEDMTPEVSLPSSVIEAGEQYDDEYPLPAVEPLPGQMNYAAMDPQDFFEQQMQMIESQFNQFDPSAQMEAIFNAHEALFELLQQALPFEPVMPELSASGMGPVAMPGSASLDDIVDVHNLIHGTPSPGYVPDMPGYDACLMTPELFEQQMHGATGQMAPEGAGPDPYDQGMMPGEMYGPMSQDMMEPEMMDPYMMPGPMGPSFMPEPPPGP